MQMRTCVKATVGAMVLAVLVLHSSAASQERNEGDMLGIRVYAVHEINTFISSFWLCRVKSVNE